MQIALKLSNPAFELALLDVRVKEEQFKAQIRIAELEQLKAEALASKAKAELKITQIDQKIIEAKDRATKKAVEEKLAEQKEIVAAANVAEKSANLAVAKAKVESAGLIKAVVQQSDAPLKIDLPPPPTPKEETPVKTGSLPANVAPTQLSSSTLAPGQAEISK